MLESDAATAVHDTAGNYATGIIVFASVVITLSLLVSMLACRLFAEDEPSDKDDSAQLRRTLGRKARRLVEQASVRVWVEDRLARVSSKRWFGRSQDNRGGETLLRVSPEFERSPVSILRPDINGKLPPRCKNVTYFAVPTEDNVADEWCNMAIEELSDEIFV